MFHRSISLWNRLSNGDFQVRTEGWSGFERTFNGLEISRSDSFRFELRCENGRLGIVIQTGGRVLEFDDRLGLPVAVRPPTRLGIGGPDGAEGTALVVREVWTRMPSGNDGIEPTGEVVRPADRSERRDGPAGGEWSEFPVIELGEVLMALGRSDAGLPRDIDLDGDGEVTLLDLELAIRITGSTRSGREPKASLRDR